MRVLHVIDSLEVGGAERVCIDLTSLLIRNKVDCELLVISKKGALFNLLNKNLKITFLNRENKFSFFKMLAVSKMINNFDIIHVHMRHTFKYIKFISMIFNLKAKIILHDHYGSIHVDKTVPSFFDSFLKPKYFIGVSQDLTQWAENILKIKKKNVFLMGNIILKGFFLNQKKTKKVILVSNITRKKNQLFAIKLANNLKFKLDIYGKVLDQEYFKELKLFVKLNKLEDSIKFIHNETNIQSVLSSYEFAIQTSITESGPLVLIEFLSQSLPFLSYQTGQVSKLLIDDLPGFFVNNFEIESWSSKINNLNKTNSNTMKQVFEKFFDEKKYLNKCLRIYKEIINY